MTQRTLKTPTLPQPGDAGRTRVFERMETDLPWVGGILCAISTIGGFAAGVRFSHYFARFINNTTAWVITGVSAVAVVMLLWMLSRRVKAAVAVFDNEGLGIHGETVVGHDLDELKHEGYRVFHSVPPEHPSKGFADFDHVLVGPTGVYVIETKARSKRDNTKDNRVTVTQEGRVLVNGIEADRCPIAQVKALRNSMKAMLQRQTTLRDIFVRGVVIFPEWYIDAQQWHRAGNDVWVLNTKAFKKWIRNSRAPVRLTADDIARLASRIEDHIHHARHAAAMERERRD